MVNPCRARIYWDRNLPYRTQESDCSPTLLVEVLAVDQSFDRDTYRQSIQAAKPVRVKVVKEKKPPPEKDKWGYREGTGCARINAIITTKWIAWDDIPKSANVSMGLTHSHLRSLELKQLVLLDRKQRRAKLKDPSEKRQETAEKRAAATEKKESKRRSPIRFVVKKPKRKGFKFTIKRKKK